MILNKRQSKRDKKKLFYLQSGIVVDELKWTKILEIKNIKILDFIPVEIKGKGGPLGVCGGLY